MRSTITTVAFFAALLASSGAFAGDSGLYLGATVGQAKQSEVGFEDTDTSFKLLGGYSFNRYFAVEGGYINGGTLKDSSDGFDFEIKNDGFFAAGLFRFPVGRVVDVFAKLGYASYDSELTATDGVNRARFTNSDEDLLLGGGVEVRLGDAFRLRAEFEKVDVPDASFEILSIGATYQF